MDRLHEMVTRTLHPGARLTLVFAAVSTLGLVWCFAFGGQDTPISYAIYAFSAYALVAVVVSCVGPARRTLGRLRGNRPVALLTGNETLRAGAGGAWSVLYDLAYAAFVLVTGLHYDSLWAVAVAAYHVAIAGLGLSLALGLRRARVLADDARCVHDLRLVRRCGVLLAIMALVLAWVMGIMVAHGQAWVYDKVVVITLATFTFVSLAMAIVSIVRVRRVERTSLVASRSVALSKALVQLFFLETTMIAVFGPDAQQFRLVMEGVTGAVVFALVVAVAVALVVYASRALAASGEPGSGGSGGQPE